MFKYLRKLLASPRPAPKRPRGYRAGEVKPADERAARLPPSFGQRARAPLPRRGRGAK